MTEGSGEALDSDGVLFEPTKNIHIQCTRTVHMHMQLLVNKSFVLKKEKENEN
jgi:hypothetical protein